jgi:hypothetical protein
MELNGKLHVPAALSPGKEPQHALNTRLGGSQNLSGLFGEKKNLRKKKESRENKQKSQKQKQAPQNHKTLP